MPRKSEDYVHIGDDDDFEEVSKADAPEDEVAEARGDRLGTSELNKMIHRTMHELGQEGTELHFSKEKKSGDRVFRYYIIEKDHEKHVIFSVTADSKNEKKDEPDLATAIAAFKAQEGKKADEITKFATVLIERKRQHIVFVSGDFKTHKLEVRDSRPGIFRKNEDDLNRVLRQSGFPSHAYTTLGQQLSASQCGFYVYHYLKDYLYTGGRFALYIHLLLTDQDTYLERYVYSKQTVAEMKDIVYKHLEGYGGLMSRHRDRRLKVISAVKGANTAYDIREILIRQIDLFEGKKVESDAKKTEQFTAYFEKAPQNRSLTEGFFSAVVSALAEIDGFKTMTKTALQVRDDLPADAPMTRNRNTS